MIFLRPDEEVAAVVEKSLRSGPFDLPPAIRVECVVSLLLGQRGLPRPVPPARSRAEARELLRSLAAALDDAGLAEDVPAEAADPELVREAQRSGIGQIAYRSYALDAPTGTWMQALSERTPGGGRKRRKRRR
jgi:hypothetical protein